MFVAFFRDEGFFLSAGIAWYAMFSLVPMVLIGISTLGYLWPANQEAQIRTLEMARIYLPSSAVEHIKSNLHSLTLDRTKVGVFGVLTLLWSGRVLFRALELVLHRTWQMPIKRSFLMANLLSMTLVLLCAVITFMISGFSAFLSYVEAIFSRFQPPALFGFSLDETRFWATVNSWLITPLALTCIYLVLYVLLPCKPVPIRAAVPGAVFAALLSRLASWLYVTYVYQMIELNPVYASIGSVAGLMVWLYLSAIIFVLGCELVGVLMNDALPLSQRRVAKPAKPTRTVHRKASKAKHAVAKD
jgi:membrane protein